MIVYVDTWFTTKLGELFIFLIVLFIDLFVNNIFLPLCNHGHIHNLASTSDISTKNIFSLSFVIKDFIQQTHMVSNVIFSEKGYWFIQLYGLFTKLGGFDLCYSSLGIDMFIILHLLHLCNHGNIQHSKYTANIQW